MMKGVELSIVANLVSEITWTELHNGFKELFQSLWMKLSGPGE